MGVRGFFFFSQLHFTTSRGSLVDRQVCQQLWLHERKMVAQQNLVLPFNTGHCLAMLTAKARFSVPEKTLETSSESARRTQRYLKRRSS